MVPKFKITEVASSETLGEKLKKIREHLKFNYSDIEKITNIRKKYIKALEEGDYTSLPHNVYTKGFLKTYAKVLKISENKVLEMYKKERGIIDNIKQSKSPKSIKHLKTPKVIITPRTIIYFFSALVGLGILAYIGFEILVLTSAPKLTINSPNDNSVIKSNFIDIAGKTDIGSEIYINGQKVDTSEEGDFRVNVGIGQKGINKIKIVAKNSKNGKTTEKVTTIVAEIPDVVTPVSPELVIGKIKLSLKIGPGTTWVSIKKDGNKEFEGIILPGTIQEFEADENIILTTGNAGSTEVIFNGKSLGKMGKEGEVKAGLLFDKNTKIE